MSNETLQFVRVDVDLDAPENANPKQELEGRKDGGGESGTFFLGGGKLGDGAIYF